MNLGFTYLHWILETFLLNFAFLLLFLHFIILCKILEIQYVLNQDFTDKTAHAHLQS